MGLRDVWSSGIDLPEVLMNLLAFEEMNQVQIEIRLSSGSSGGLRDLMMTLVAHDKKTEIGEAPPLASVSLSCSGLRLRSLEAALIHGLYSLDGQLGRQELGSEAPKKA